MICKSCAKAVKSLDKSAGALKVTAFWQSRQQRRSQIDGSLSPSPLATAPPAADNPIIMLRQPRTVHASALFS
ncbi:hypothetical protein CKO12_06665 [Chromatium okenii]|nr:hypothetical protein [Chromatium okenii]